MMALGDTDFLFANKTSGLGLTVRVDFATLTVAWQQELPGKVVRVVQFATHREALAFDPTAPDPSLRVHVDLVKDQAIYTENLVEDHTRSFGSFEELDAFFHAWLTATFDEASHIDWNNRTDEVPDLRRLYRKFRQASEGPAPAPARRGSRAPRPSTRIRNRRKP